MKSCPLPYFFMTRPPPTPALFPYTTLFRSATAALGLTLLTGGLLQGRSAATAEAPTRANPYWVYQEDAVIEDRKSTRLNSSHLVISYAVFCLKKKNNSHPERDCKRKQLRCC